MIAVTFALSLRVFGSTVASRDGTLSDQEFASVPPSRDGTLSDQGFASVPPSRDGTLSKQGFAAVPLEGAGGLRPFFRELAEIDLGRRRSVVRVLHYGDSTIGLDGIPKAIRRRMQERFGDGGAGFVLLQRYMPDYKPHAAALESNGKWEYCYIIHDCEGDGHYGLGGVTFFAPSGVRAQTRIATLPRTARRTVLGHRAERIELWYAAHPRGGTLEVSIDEGPTRRIDTRAPALADRFERWQLRNQPHAVTLRAAGGGSVRAYGVVLETGGPGVTWESLSMLGAFTKRLLNWDAEHLERQMKRRDPDLIVLSYGGNDLRRMVAAGLTAAKYRRELAQVLTLLRAGKPGVPCLVTGIIDHGRIGQYEVPSTTVTGMVDAQRAEALAHGCAFFSAYDAMGGAGSMRRWRQRDPALTSPDLKHLNRRGREAMGAAIYGALLRSYGEYTLGGARRVEHHPPS